MVKEKVLKIHIERKMNSPKVRYRLVKSKMKYGNLSLDVGCGDTGLIFEFSEKSKEIVGLDARLESLEKMKLCSQKNIYYVCADAEEFPFEDKIFDNILMVEVLEHLKSPRKGIEEAIRCLKQSGKIIITTPNENALYRRLIRFFTKHRCSSLDEDPTHRHAFTYEKLKNLLNSFSNIEHKFHKTKTHIPFDDKFKSLRYFWAIGKVHPSLGYFLCAEIRKKED